MIRTRFRINFADISGIREMPNEIGRGVNQIYYTLILLVWSYYACGSSIQMSTQKNTIGAKSVLKTNWRSGRSWSRTAVVRKGQRINPRYYT